MHGNIIWLHGLGFHALQAVPLAAWLTERTSLASPARHRLIHLTGCAYLLGLAAIACQTARGLSVFEWSALPLFACGCFLVALTAGAIALYHVIAFQRQSGVKRASA